MQVGGTFLDNYIRAHIRLLLLALFAFTAGSVWGAVYCARLPHTANEALYGAFAGREGLLAVTDSFRIFCASFVNYLRLWVLLSLCATSRLGVPFAPMLLGVRGFLCGFSVAALFVLYGLPGTGAAAAGILPQMLLALPAMQLLCCVAMHRALAPPTADRTLRRSRFFVYCIFCLAILCMFALAAFYEGYIGWRLILKILSNTIA